MAIYGSKDKRKMVSVKLTMKIAITDVGLSCPTYYENKLSRSIMSLNELSMAIIIHSTYIVLISG